MIIPEIKKSPLEAKQQLDKIQEEFDELKREFQTDIIDEEKMIGEAFDVIQATFTLVFSFENDDKEIFKLWHKHVNKLNARHTKKEIKISNYIVL